MCSSDLTPTPAPAPAPVPSTTVTPATNTTTATAAAAPAVDQQPPAAPVDKEPASPPTPAATTTEPATATKPAADAPATPVTAATLLRRGPTSTAPDKQAGIRTPPMPRSGRTATLSCVTPPATIGPLTPNPEFRAPVQLTEPKAFRGASTGPNATPSASRLGRAQRTDDEVFAALDLLIDDYLYECSMADSSKALRLEQLLDDDSSAPQQITSASGDGNPTTTTASSSSTAATGGSGGGGGEDDDEDDEDAGAALDELLAELESQ